MENTIDEKTMDKVIEILLDIQPNLEKTIRTETKLIDNNILESFDIITLVGDLNSAFDVKIGAGDLIPANFNSAAAICALIQKKLKD